MANKNCERCFRGRNVFEPATRCIDEEYLCFACIRELGLDPMAGEPVTAAPLRAASTQTKSAAKQIVARKSPARRVAEAERKNTVPVKTKPTYKPKACADCGEEFTPTGARSDRCDGCRNAVAKPGEVVPREVRPSARGLVRVASPVAGVPAIDEGLALQYLERFVERAWSRMTLTQKAAVLDSVDVKVGEIAAQLRR